MHFSPIHFPIILAAIYLPATWQPSISGARRQRQKHQRSEPSIHSLIYGISVYLWVFYYFERLLLQLCYYERFLPAISGNIFDNVQFAIAANDLEFLYNIWYGAWKEYRCLTDEFCWQATERRRKFFSRRQSDSSLIVGRIIDPRP
jgi:hypothetical protein